MMRARAPHRNDADDADDDADEAGERAAPPKRRFSIFADLEDLTDAKPEIPSAPVSDGVVDPQLDEPAEPDQPDLFLTDALSAPVADRTEHIDAGESAAAHGDLSPPSIEGVEKPEETNRQRDEEAAKPALGGNGPALPNDSAADRFAGDGVEVRNSPPSLAEVASWRARAWDAGYRPVSIYGVKDGRCFCGRPAGKCKPGKHPNGFNWEGRARANPPEAAEAPVNPKSPNTGLLCDGLRPLDLDIDDPELVARVRALAVEKFGPTILRWRPGSGRCLALYRAAEGEPIKRVLAGKLGKIEVLGHGQQFVAFGMHESGARLQWSPESPVETPAEDLPAVTEDQITAFFTSAVALIEAEMPGGNDAGAHATSGSGQQGEFFEVVQALAQIPNSGPPDWEHWNRVGMATWAATAGSAGGFDAWCAWSKRHPSFDPGAAAVRWENYFRSPPTRIGAGTLIHLAHEARSTERNPPPATSEGDYGGVEGANATRAGLAPIESGPKPPAVITLPEEALHGLLGEIVRAWEPETEAHPAALLGSLLVMFGNAAGRGPYILHAGVEHRLNLYLLVVGATARSRKGTSRALAERMFVNTPWLKNCNASGFGSGEALIEAVGDPTGKKDKKGNKIIIPGATDKRLLMTEGEFTRIIAVMQRESSVLSAVLRDAWDGRTLQIKTRGNPITATGAHVSVLAHITAEELRRNIDRTELVNGFLNRFILIHVHRTKLLPMGGEQPPAIAGLTLRLRRALDRTEHMGRMHLAPGTAEIWAAEYRDLERERPGLLNYLTVRASPQVLRLAMVYAVTDGSLAIEPAHLRAALALWSYCETSAGLILGDATGDPTVDTIAEALRRAGPEGLSRTDINKGLFSGNKTAAEIDHALQLLERGGQAERYERSTKGRSVERWRRLGPSTYLTD
jgi:Primase C terminal 2 (PriCT-2)/Bifunctional DNA primase/polymerase, N-terminal